MARLFDNILKNIDIAEEEEIYFEDGNKEMTDDDINHYAKVYGFEVKARRSAVTTIWRRKNIYLPLIVFFIGCIRNILIKRG